MHHGLIDRIERKLCNLKVRLQIHCGHLINDSEKVYVSRILKQVSKTGSRIPFKVLTLEVNYLTLIAMHLQIKIAQQIQLLVQLYALIFVAF